MEPHPAASRRNNALLHNVQPSVKGSTGNSHGLSAECRHESPVPDLQSMTHAHLSKTQGAPTPHSSLSSPFYGVGSSISWKDGLTLSESVYPASFKMPPHSHQFPYLGIVLAGRYDESVGRRRRSCGPLTTAFHPAGESHSVVFHSARTRIFRLQMGPSWAERVREYTRAPSSSLEYKGGPLAWLVLRLHSEFRLRDEWSRLAIEGLALEIMAELARAGEGSSKAAAPEWLEQAREILTARLSQTPSLADLARSLGVHPVHLAREFRRRFRCTIGEYIRQRRIEFACREISNTEAPLTQIALAAGFYDQSHFSNTFRRLTGLTPAAYRAICRSR